MARFADHGAGLPDLRAVVVDAQMIVRDVEHDVGLAEVARHPAPPLHGGEHGVESPGAARRIQRLDGRAVQLAGDLDVVGFLEFADRHGKGGVVVGIGLGRQAKPLAHLRHAGIRHHGFLALVVADVAQHRTVADAGRLVLGGLIAQLRELGLERLIGRLRRIECFERRRQIVGAAIFFSTSSASNASL